MTTPNRRQEVRLVDQPLGDTQGLSLEDIEERASQDREVRVIASNLADPVNAAEAARLVSGISAENHAETAP